MEQAYCVRCKDQREVKNAEMVTLKNGRPALKGTCATCGTSAMKFLKKQPA